MVLSVHQPQYLPWLGYFAKIYESDIFVFLDNVQYIKNEWKNRNKIKTNQGAQWITVPVHYKFGENINEIETNSKLKWQKKHLQMIKMNYSKAEHFQKYFHAFEEFYTKKNWDNLAELNIELTLLIAKLLGITKTKFYTASEYNFVDGKSERLVDICQQFGANRYIAGKDGESYIQKDLFSSKNIDVLFQDYTHPVYEQLYGDFVSHLSAIDLLFNCGDESLKILLNMEN